ncbi:gti1/Pac2 family domain-containing protein [Trichoderma breve]|uniref:Gti1/Pac2 family domain-containing protein n=1 Tax=Trichoderma breve TaxID=2034170 RepID=A0A9W9E396_9HYPO|nr:gti1/Pac2 family domain-containing protein [Trichoderma breve]KAJ4855425.1 gti1/Pac2 family domain-containing protein [Trichoderma breve]
MASQSPLNPTFKGHVATTWDALLLFEACLQGQINHVPRRPHDRERQELISSGNIFIYEEHASGIKRWTDGISWSPSRILGNFLIYRELDKPFPPGEKKRALKRKRGSQGVNKATPRSNSTVLDPATIARDPERSLVGSLVDSYLFKERGLVKKTISITFQGVPHHLVSYYSIEDVDNKSLMTPSEANFFSHIKPRTELVMSQNFRNPVDEVTLFGQEDNGFMGANAHFYNMGAHVANFSPHSHVAQVADYGSQVMMSQALPVSTMAVAPMAAYSRADYEYLAQQHQPHDHFEAQVEAQAQAEAQARYAHRHHSFQYHDHIPQGQLPQEALHHQQIQQQQMHHHQQQLQRQQQLQHQMHAIQMQQQQQQFHHQMHQPQPDEQRQHQLSHPSPHQQDVQPDEQQQNGEGFDWSNYQGPNDYYYPQQP